MTSGITLFLHDCASACLKPVLTIEGPIPYRELYIYVCRKQNIRWPSTTSHARRQHATSCSSGSLLRQLRYYPRGPPDPQALKPIPCTTPGTRQRPTKACSSAPNSEPSTLDPRVPISQSTQPFILDVQADSEAAGLCSSC